MQDKGQQTQRAWGQPSPFFVSPGLRIWFAHLSFDRKATQYSVDKHLLELGEQDFVFLFLSWDKCGLDDQRFQQYQDLFRCQVIICANTPEEYQLVLQAQARFPRLRCIYYNQNATLDPKLFSIQHPSAAHPPFQHSLLVNSCFAAFKRSHLTRAVRCTVAHIGYANRHLPVVLPPTSTQSDEPSPEALSGTHILLNTDPSGHLAYMQPGQVAAAINASTVGGIFSAVEGPCYACTEYLLCGCPVVSTPSKGGRSVWLSSQNSVIVPPTEEGVAQGVDEALHTVWDRQAIREGTLQLRQSFWETLHTELQGIFDRHGVAVDAAAYAREHFVHKMGL